MPESEARHFDLYCPNCNLVVAAGVIGTHVVMKSGQFVLDVDSDPIYGEEYAFSVCRRCESPFLTKQGFVEIPAEYSGPTGELVVLFPGRNEARLDNVPEIARTPFLTASQSFTGGLYEPCLIMCRKCVEAICRELNPSGRSLFHKLRYLRDQTVIDAKLIDWADGLRVIGNDAAHDLDIHVDKQDAADALEFVEALLVYIFSLSRRFEEFQRRRTSPKGDGSGDGN